MRDYMKDFIVKNHKLVIIAAAVMALIVIAALIGNTRSEVSTPEMDEYDQIFYDFLSGKETGADGNAFWGIDLDDVEYAMLDINGDKHNELIIRSDGYWIPDIMVVKNGKVTCVGVTTAGSSGLSIINTNNQYVGGDNTHASRDQYWVSEIDENGNAKVILFFAKYWDDWSKSGAEEYYKKENPTEDVYLSENYDKITEEVYEELLNKYVQENIGIEWRKVKELIVDGTPDRNEMKGQ